MSSKKHTSYFAILTAFAHSHVFACELPHVSKVVASFIVSGVDKKKVMCKGRDKSAKLILFCVLLFLE